MAENHHTLLEESERELNRLLLDLKQAVQADVVTMTLSDLGSGRHYLQLAHGLKDKATFWDPRMRPCAQQLLSRVINLKSPIVANRIAGHHVLDRPFAHLEQIVSAACFPMLDQGKPVGVLFVNYRRSHDFSDKDRSRAEQTAQAAARYVTRNGVLDLCQDAAPSYLADEVQALEAMTHLACDLTNKSLALWIVHPGENRLELMALTGLTTAYLDSARAVLGDESIISEVIRCGCDQRIKDLENDPKRFPYAIQARAAGWTSMIALPVKHRDQTLGVIEVFLYEGQTLSDGETGMIRRLAEMVGVAVQNLHHLWAMRKLSKAAHDLTAAPGTQPAVDLIARHARQLVGGHSAIVFLRDEHEHLMSFGAGDPQPEDWSLPRLKGGLSQQVIESGDPVIIRDTLHDGRVRQEVRDQGIRSLIGVRLILERELLGVLFVEGQRPDQFSDEHVQLLQTLADHVSTALGWARRLLKPLESIETATSVLAGADEVWDQVCREALEEDQYDLAALQLVRHEERIIETVHGLGPAGKWIGLRHSLEAQEGERDIQAHIVLADAPPRAEIIRGWDPRFHQWVYREYGHRSFVRIWIPLILLRDADGNLDNRWVDQSELSECREEMNEDSETGELGWCQAIEIDVPSADARGNPVEKEIIGTLEIGYLDSKRRIYADAAKQLIRYALHKAKEIRETMLEQVLETIAEQARNIVKADLATLHITSATAKDVYEFEVGVGPGSRNVLTHFRPRECGLGSLALSKRKPLCVSGSKQVDGKSLREFNPATYELGIREMCAFPIDVEGKQGVLYIAFQEDHRIHPDEIGWVGLFVKRAAESIHQATVHHRMRDRARQMKMLHVVAQSLSAEPDSHELLDRVAWSALDIFAADIVSIFEYEEPQRRCHTDPKMAGRLRAAKSVEVMSSHPFVPVNFIEGKENLYLSDLEALRPVRDSKREDEDFIAREGIQACGGILLKVSEEILGAMFINYRRPHVFSEDEESLIATLASSVAVAVKSRRLLVERRQKELITIAHNVQSPLTSAVTFLDGLAWDTVPEKARERVRSAYALVDDALTVVHGMFISLVGESGKTMSFSPVYFEVGEVLCDFLDRFRLSTGSGRLRFEHSLPPDIPTVFMDQDVFKSVMYALLFNADKYADGGSTVTLSCRTRGENAAPVIAVESVGEPIAEEEKDLIFEKFRRGKTVESTGRHHSGAGMGLWSARELMRAVNGDLTLQLSKKDPRRSIFLVQLPRS